MAAAALALLLAGCDAADAPAPPSASVSPTNQVAPDAEACELEDPIDDGERIRKRPLRVPAKLRTLMSSSKDALAVRTLGGGVYCVDARWIESISDTALSPDGRFLSIDWSGYEAFGHLVVDRSGKGSEFDTGTAPVRSPTGARLAAVEWSESSYGALQGVAVWRIDPVGVKQLDHTDDLPFLFQWQIDRWVGEDCVELSAVSAEHIPERGWQRDRAKRRQFAYREGGGGWTLAPGTCRAG